MPAILKVLNMHEYAQICLNRPEAEPKTTVQDN